MDNNEHIAEKHFLQRLDFYYQTTAIYSIVLLAYSLLKGTIEGGKVTISIIDPISILLAIFIIGTLISLAYNLSKRREIIIGSDYIIFRAGKKRKKYLISEIEKISITVDRAVRFRSKFRMVLIKVPSRKRAVWIRLTSYHNDKELAEAMIELKRQVGRQ